MINLSTAPSGTFRLIFALGVCTSLLASSPGWTQTYSLKVNAARFELEGQTYDGYATSFVQDSKEVKKAWWKYVNTRTIIFNKKTHYVLTIPARGKATNTPLKFVSQWLEQKSKKSADLRIALVTDDIPEDKISQLKKQASALLKDFKVSYFTGLIQAKIDDKEAEAQKISRSMDKYLLQNSKIQSRLEKIPAEKEKHMPTLVANIKTVEKLQAELNEVQKALVSYKNELKLIK